MTYLEEDELLSKVLKHIGHACDSLDEANNEGYSYQEWINRLEYIYAEITHHRRELEEAQ